MDWPLEFGLLIILLISAVLALRVRDLLAAVAILSAYSFFVALLFAHLGAVDVALIEATLGAGVTGVVFILAIFFTQRRSED